MGYLYFFLEYVLVSIMYGLTRHDNIVKLAGFCKEPELVILTKRYEGDLKRLIHSKETVAELPLWSLVRDIVCGLEAIHELKIVHRDIKSSNILVERIGKKGEDRSWRAVIADFGLSYVFAAEDVLKREKIFTFGFSYPFASPEIFRQKYLGARIDQSETSETLYQKIDVYAFGCVVWEMLERASIWKGTVPDQIEKNVLEGQRPPFSPQFEKHSARSIIELSWAQNAGDRPSFPDLHEMVANIMEKTP